jgi:glyoxylase-like metal-dependent hydrolase (beta-lactamase superfamily II)
MIIILKLSKTNCYLLPLPEGYLLVDTGYTEDKEKFFHELKKHRITPREIRFIFLTHHHDDHAGLLNDLVGLNPEIRIIMHRECVELLKEGINARKFGGAWCSKPMKTAAELYSKINRKWSLSFPPYTIRKNDIILSDDETALEPFTDRKLKAIFSPGHSVDHISLLDEDMNLFCGDAASNYLRILGTKYAPPFITDLEQFYKTWQTFIDSGIKILYPSHGKPIEISKLKKHIHALSADKMGKFVWG